MKILHKLENLSNGIDVQLYWVQSHTRISGNNQADKAAREVPADFLETYVWH